MKWKTWIWQMDVRQGPKWKEGMKGLAVEHKDLEWMEYKDLEWMDYKDLEWTWKMNDGKFQVWKEELQMGKKWKAYQQLERLFLHWDTYHF